MSNTIQETSQQLNEKAPHSELAPLLHPDVIFDGLKAQAEIAYQSRLTGRLSRPASSLAAVDKELCGGFPEGITVIGGNSGSGKTAFVNQAAAHADCPALVVTVEMSPVELLRRDTARETNTFLSRLKDGQFTPEECVNRARQAYQKMPQKTFMDATCNAAPIEWIEGCVCRLKGDSCKFLLVIDSFHAWARSNYQGHDEYKSLGLAYTALQQLVARTPCSILVVVERNRGSADFGGLNSGAGHRIIEYGCEAFIDLQRKSEECVDAKDEVSVKLVFAKNRNGAANKTIELKYKGATQCFREAN